METINITIDEELNMIKEETVETTVDTIETTVETTPIDTTTMVENNGQLYVAMVDDGPTQPQEVEVAPVEPAEPRWIIKTRGKKKSSLKECPHCDSKFIDKHDLKRHIKVLHKEESKKRKHSDDEDDDDDDDADPIIKRNNSGKPYKCEWCDAAFKKRAKLKIHSRIHTGERPYKCDFSDECMASFIQKGDLKKHLTTHTAGEKPHHCDHCPATFISKSNLTRHKKICHPEEGATLEHEATAETDADGKIRIFAKIGKKAGGKKRRKKNLTQEKVKNVRCAECNAQFANAANLKAHSVVHTGERPYVCNDCGAGFTTSSNLKTHSMIHTGIKPHKCDECNAAFRTSSNLRTHMMTHTGEKPYRCTQCDAGFTTSSNLKQHAMRHMGEKPYKCKQCDAAFTTNTNLKKHVISHMYQMYSVNSAGDHDYNKGDIDLASDEEDEILSD